MGKEYFQLSRDERVVIAMMLEEGSSLSELARKLGRSKSTISREVKRNGSPLKQSYTMPWVQSKAQGRKTRASRRQRLKNDETRLYVQSRLRLGWSPELISGRIGMEHPGLAISHEAIYQYIYAQPRGSQNRRDLVVCLRYGNLKHRKKRVAGGSPRKTKIPNRVGIEERPKDVESREVFGHWEGDTMVSKKSRVVLQSLVERKSRLVLLRLLSGRTAAETANSVIKRLGKFPSHARRTLTLDNGTENAGHAQITSALGTKCYFARQYASWQRGTNENINGLVRYYLPKGTDFEKVSEEEIAMVESLINNRPKKCLGFQTPIEVAALCVALAH